MSWAFAEGGSGIIGIAPDGLKKWGEKRGAYALAADDNYVYAITSSWHTKGRLCRLAKADGSYQPFVLDGKPRPLELSLQDLGIAEERSDRRRAGGRPARWRPGRARSCWPRRAASWRSWRPPPPNCSSCTACRASPALAIGASPEGRCYAVQDGRIVSVDLETGKVTAFAKPDLARPAAIAVDNDGNLVVADVGPDSQVKAYDAAGKCVYTCGRKGGRPIRGPFDPRRWRT